MPAPADQPTPEQSGKRRSDDDALLADLTAPPSLEEARKSYLYWRRRLASLPIHKRAERKEATEMVARWKQRLSAAERDHYGPGLIEQLLNVLNVRWRPSPRRLIAGLGAVALLLVIVLVAIVVAVVAFWPELEPIVRTLLDGGGG